MQIAARQRFRSLTRPKSNLHTDQVKSYLIGVLGGKFFRRVLNLIFNNPLVMKGIN